MYYALENIGKQLQKERARYGLTQRAFAKMAGTTQARISKLENGELNARLSTLIEIARNLNLEFMLIPRQHVPAVNAIIKQQPYSSKEKSWRLALNQLQKVVERLNNRYPDNQHLENLRRTSLELSNFRPRSVHHAPITKTTEALKQIESTPALIGSVGAQAADLRQLRNTLAHDVSDDISKPRPAYRLDGNDDG